ncbi:MAG: sulfur transfer protein TusE [Candidatus Westeberhardia cardiocondylae]|nr:sulfur transfer protein TusE [Candidatus Westeberhardia cardiocondylae]
MILNIKNISIDSYGYLLNSKDWNRDIAKEIAYCEGITLSREHWQIIYFLRFFYLEHNMVPGVRIIVENIKKKYGKNKGNSCYLFYLFPKGPIKQATKIAGLPRQMRCL